MERKDARGARHANRKLVEPEEELNKLAGRVLAAAIDVHRYLGPGFLESVYEESLVFELVDRNISFARQIAFPVMYRGRVVGQSRLDLLVEEQLVLELKAVEEIRPVHRAQLLSYLRAGEFHLGLLINFNVPVLLRGVQRVVWSG
jgi:GxxExxY protein